MKIGADDYKLRNTHYMQRWTATTINFVPRRMRHSRTLATIIHKALRLNLITLPIIRPCRCALIAIVREPFYQARRYATHSHMQRNLLLAALLSSHVAIIYVHCTTLLTSIILILL